MLLAACAGSGFTYVKSSETNTFFKVPKSWRLFEEREVFAAEGGALSPQRAQAAQASQWLMAFDGDPRPSLDHILEVMPRHPAGFAKVRLLSPVERDTYSLASIRNAVFPIDRLSKEGEGEVLSKEDVALDNGLHGSRIVFNVKRGDEFMTVNQTGLIDPETRLLYLFLVGCEAGCYTKNQSLIQQVVSSWTIKE